MKNYSCQSCFISLSLLMILPAVVFGNAMLSTSVSGTAGGSPSQSCSNNGTSSAGCSLALSGTVLFGTLPYTGSLSASAVAAYGHITSQVQVTATQDIGFYVTASASFEDTLTVLGGSGNGFVDYNFGGTITTISDLGNGFTFQQNSFPSEGYFTSNFNQVNVPIQYRTALYPFTFGVPFTIHVSALANTLGSGDGFGQGEVDLSLLRIDVANQQGVPITSFSVATDSGALFPTPEPSSGLLFATAVLLFCSLGCILAKRNRSAGPQSAVTNQS